VVRLGLDKEISPDGTYYAYFPFGLMIERPRMAAYHDKEKICWESGVVVALTRNMADGTYYAYFPFAILTEASLMRRYHNKLLPG
jgi:hypothetical protein